MVSVTETCLSYGFGLKFRLNNDGLTPMNLKFVFVLIISLFIISCVTVTENTEEDSEDPFEFATGGISDRSIEEGVIDIRDRDVSTSTPDWVAPPRPSDAAQEYPDFRVSNDLVGYFDITQECNPNVIRTPQAHIEWIPSPEVQSNMRLDVTHYGVRTGFAPNGFVSLDLSRDSTTRFTNVHSQDPEYLLNTTFPDLSVMWFDVPENQRAVGNLIIVEGLDAGINYTWRLVGSVNGRTFATPSQTTQIQVCVADLKKSRE